MNNLKILRNILILTIISAGITVCTTSFCGVTAETVTKSASNIETRQNNEIKVAPLTVVNTPRAYLNKSIIMNAKFDKFSTLGLDYKPALKSSEEYISFLIKRDDTQFSIPLSEMKLFLKRSEAEKFIDLKADDEIEIKGIVFSDALGDTWIDVNSLKIIQKAPDNEKK